jgi:hypothetical protein
MAALMALFIRWMTGVPPRMDGRAVRYLADGSNRMNVFPNRNRPEFVSGAAYGRGIRRRRHRKR